MKEISSKIGPSSTSTSLPSTTQQQSSPPLSKGSTISALDGKKTSSINGTSATPTGHSFPSPAGKENTELTNLMQDLISKLTRSAVLITLSAIFLMSKAVCLLGADYLRSSVTGVTFIHIWLLFASQCVSNLEV